MSTTTSTLARWGHAACFQKQFQDTLRTCIRTVATFGAFAAVAVFASSAPANASQAWGSINNFDTVNDTGVECHGFEIEIDGIHKTDITYTYDWNHYGAPKITEDNSNPLLPKVFVRYMSAKRPDGTWAALTIVPTGPILPTQGHQFTNPAVNFGGEHFGVGYLGTPTSVAYSWLKDDGLGNLVFAGAVTISTPTFTYVPPAPAVPAVVQAAIVPPPPPVPPVLEFGEASWVKEIKTSSHNNRKVELRDLVSDDPADPNFKNWKNGEPDEVEVEWRILQKSSKQAGGGANGELRGAPEGLPHGDEIITRRYEFYKYVGPRDAETGEAMADVVGPDGKHGSGLRTYADYFDFALGEWHIATKDMATFIVVGDFNGAQMAGFDAAAQIGLIDHVQDGVVNEPYARRLVIGGTAPIVSVFGGVLPNGMSFDEVTGILSGTPTQLGSFNFSIHSTDAAGGDITKKYILTILNFGEEQLAHVSISASASPAVGGTLSGDGEYLLGNIVTVTAAANPGYAFISWTDGGAIVSADASYSFEAIVNRGLVANFVPTAAVSISTSALPVAGGTTSGGGNYLVGDSATVVASPIGSYGFVNWKEGAAIVSTSASYTFTVAGARSLVANFALKRASVLSMATFSCKVGASAVISVTMKDKLTKGVLAGKSIQFSIEGVNIGAPQLTNASGKATLTFLVREELAMGLHAVGASFGGDNGYLPSTTSSTMNVAKGPVKLTVTNAAGKRGVTVNLVAKIVNYSNVPMDAETILFTVDGLSVGSATTNALGVATLAYTIPAGATLGAHPFVATFLEDIDHLGAVKNGVVQVK